MAGLGRYGRDNQEAVRRSFSAPTITQNDPAKIVFFDREVYGLKQRVFDCERISAQVTQEQCAASHLRNNIGSGCHNCSIGRHFSSGAPIAEDRHSAINKSLGLSCIRCERNEHTATRYAGRFRLVQSHTLCVSCANRGYEHLRGGFNSKGAKIKKWAHLQQATITIEDAAGEWKALDIGLRSGRGECERYVARIHPGCVLVEVFMGGNAVQPGDSDPTPADWKADAMRKMHATVARKRKPKPLPVASDREAFHDEDDCWPSRKAAEIEPVESALDPESVAAFWDGLSADRLPDFIEWLCEGWPEPAAPTATVEYLSEVTGNPWTGFVVTKRPIGEPAEPSAPVADAIAPAEVAETTVSDSEHPEQESEWAGCYSARDGVTTYVCDYAKERGISDEEAAIVLGMCDPEYIDEPEPVPAAAPAIASKNPEAKQPAPKKLTGKQLRKLEKAQRRAERQQQHTAKHMPATKATPTAIASRALAIFGALAIAAR
jgi:hypothetical protein